MSISQPVGAVPQFSVTDYTARSGRQKKAVALTGPRLERTAWEVLHAKAKEAGAWWVRGAGWVFKDEAGCNAFLALARGTPEPPRLHVVPAPVTVPVSTSPPARAARAPRARKAKTPAAPATPPVEPAPTGRPATFTEHVERAGYRVCFRPQPDSPLVLVDQDHGEVWRGTAEADALAWVAAAPGGLRADWTHVQVGPHGRYSFADPAKAGRFLKRWGGIAVTGRWLGDAGTSPTSRASPSLRPCS